MFLLYLLVGVVVAIVVACSVAVLLMSEDGVSGYGDPFDDVALCALAVLIGAIAGVLWPAGGPVGAVYWFAKSRVQRDSL